MPVRKVVHQFRACREHLHGQVRFDDIDAIHQDAAAPEGVDSAGEDQLMHRRKPRTHSAGSVGDPHIVDHDPVDPPSLDLHRPDGDTASQPSLQCLLDPKPHQVGEVRRPQIPPAAADDEQEDHCKTDHAAAHPAHAAPHRALSLALPCGAVVMLLGGGFGGHAEC